jgi:glycosyltransferase involved in cell wall biosynthesis/GT2 family glycosyltransferase
LSGAPMQLLHYLRVLDRDDWDVTFAAPAPGPISDSLASHDTQVVFDATFLTDLAHTALRRTVRDYDIVVANTIASWPAVRAARAARVPVIWYIHETRVGVWLMEQIAQIRPTLRDADLIVAPTRETARIYEPLSRGAIEVVPYGIPDRGQSAPPYGDGVRFLVLGSYEPRKGQDIMIDAVRRLPAEARERSRFTFVGRVLDDDFYRRIEDAAIELPNVQLLGPADHDAALRLLLENDALVVPSRDETMPIAIIEAMRAGRAVISTDVGGIHEWLHDGLNGWLVPPEQPAALASAISRAASDPRLRMVLAAAGRRTYERHFRLENFAEHFSKLLAEVQARGARTKNDAPRSYAEWIRKFDTLDDAERAALRRRLRALRRQPLISVAMPVFNPEPRFLHAAVESVKRQIYARWELCIADDASSDPAVRPVLEAAARSDSRIKVTFRENNGHISAASNSALELATGEWLALLDHDDELAENALAFVALEIDAHPNAALIYSDEDKIDESGARSNAFFKTDWNPELFLGQNFINHLGVYRTELLREIGGFREGFEGSQDYDLALRCIERLAPEQIRHIPRVLYHWRTAAGSLAAIVDAKPYAREAARRAIADHMRRCAVAGRAEPCPENAESHRFAYALPAELPLVSVIILTRDRAQLLRQCVRSLREKTDYSPIEIIIVNNGSREQETFELFDELKAAASARVITNDGAFNFSRLNNAAARIASGDVLALLNNDIEAEEPGWLSEMVSHVMRPEVGAVGARLWFPNDTLQHAGVVLGLGGVAGHVHARNPRGHPGYFNRVWLQGNYSAVTGACMLVRRKVFQRFGGFNERELPINFNDIEFCLRLRRAGLQIVWTPYANLTHHESASRGHHRTRQEQAQFAREAAYMQETWGRELLNDPFYNPNFSLNLPGYELAFPPRVITTRHAEAGA